MILRQEQKEKQKEIKKKNGKPVREHTFALLNEHIIIEGPGYGNGGRNIIFIY